MTPVAERLERLLGIEPVRFSTNGVILWKGPSRLTGDPIVVIATGLKAKSANGKTGTMLQTWIIRSDVHPVEAVHSGADQAICGDCPLRPALAAKHAATCYVNKGFAPAAVYKGYLRGIYPVANPADVGEACKAKSLPIRLGSYGDPGAVPTAVWEALTGESRKRTGYSHQWRRRKSLQGLTMASADTLADATRAQSAGWRTFRVIGSVDQLAANEILCPASAEAGRKTHCADCGLCSGSLGSSDKRRNIAIVDHGPTTKRVRKAKA